MSFSSPRSCGPTVRRSGFTLIEVLTALVITGVVALLAYRLLNVTVGAARELDQARLAQDRHENARRWLRAAFLSLEAGGTAGGFDGLRDRVTFTAWLEQPSGWFAPERLSLAASDGHLAVSRGASGLLILADSVTMLDLDYLLEPGADTRWVREWLSPLSAPLVVRLRIGRREGPGEVVDTLLLLIKERG
jgi:prepilin-type N-terminal cleavage/methylation domain-containing protein